MSDSSDLVYNNLFLSMHRMRNITVFVSGAERIGSSWCAINMAYAINSEKKRVLLVDGNGNFSNIEAYITLNTNSYLEDYIKGKKTLNQLVTPYRNRDFCVLSAKTGNNFLTEQPLGRIHLFAEDLKILAENFEHTIIDLGQIKPEENLGLCQIANNILIMCSENNADLIKTFEFIRYMNETGVCANCNLIINKVNSFEDGYKVYEKLNKATDRNGLKCPNLLGIVRFDTRVRDAIRNRDLLITRYPTSEASTDICNIAQKIIKGDCYE